MAPRHRNYNKIPVFDKTRLRESFNRGEDFQQLAKILGITRTTAYSIVNRDQDKERGGNRQTNAHLLFDKLLVTGMLRKRLDLSPSRDCQNIPIPQPD